MAEPTQNIVADASVVAKWFYPEAGSDAARSLLADIRGEQARAHVPELLFAEVASVARRHVLSEKSLLSATDAGAVLDELTRVPFRIHTLRSLTLSALDISLETNCSVYDAYYAAVALRVDGVVVTADTRFAATMAASSYSDRVVSLEWFLS